MNNHYRYVLLGLFVLLINAPLLAYAQVNANTGLTGSVGVDIGSTQTITTGVETQTQTNTSPSLSSELPAQTAASDTLATDTRVSNIAVASTSVSMAYPVEAKLFGVFPLVLTAQVKVASNGSVAINYPWYAFFFSTDQAQLQTKLQVVGHAASTWDTSRLSAEQQVELMTLIHQALQSNLQSTSSASGTV